mmetsp:Transcript_11930/g.24564  ORF Transcript_11930/g.24564 Transcript_11930/m.24564 type:complete len:263 (-) Transcript_11930:171-959(-)
MMSGGNGFDKSDMAAASKWQFNWIVDDAIVMMQPEGSTPNCPQCLASVSNLKLKSFDDTNVMPSSSSKMAVHIPIFGNNGQAFSYWLSYRGTGNDGLAAGGLSIHVSHFQVCDGMFGSSYDSTNYDAFGNTADDTTDSFVVPGTCYVVAPSVETMDIDFGAVDQVQPIVCVDGLNQGSDITVSVSFLDPSSPPQNTVALESEQNLGCSQGSTSSGDIVLDVSGGKNHLLHYTGTGRRGLVDASLCLASSDSGATATAYFYDT